MSEGQRGGTGSVPQGAVLAQRFSLGDWKCISLRSSWHLGMIGLLVRVGEFFS